MTTQYGSTARLAELLDLSPRTVQRLVQTGVLLPPVRIGKRAVRHDLAKAVEAISRVQLRARAAAN